ncbi:MAG: serine hydrolase [Trebonia sp.]
MSVRRDGRHSLAAVVVLAAGPVAVAAALFILFLAFPGGGGRPAAAPAANAGQNSGPTRPATTAPAGRPSTARAPASAGATIRSTSPSPLPSRTPAPAAARHPDPLAGAAASYLSQRAGTVLAAVYDVRTGQTWSLGQGRAQPAASVVKLDVLETLLAQQRSGLSAANQSLAQLMIEDSDNDAATSLWYAAGGAAGLQAYNEAAGLTGTSPSPCVECAGFAWPGWGLTTTDPQDQITLLKELIGPGPLLTQAERGYALSLLENVTPSQRWGVSGGVPAQVTVALKNGWLPLDSADTDWQINSVGWISGDGGDYLMAVLSTGNPTEQYGIDTINQLAATVWNVMR